jgi:hypothetical protein
MNVKIAKAVQKSPPGKNLPSKMPKMAERPL